ncbi:MAG: SAM-dependent methyltransferase, partial [Blautia coccoides]
MKGKLFGLGVGPGDPELLTLKALRLIRESEVIAVPGNDVKESVAYKIVKGAYEDLDKKE